MRSFVGPTASTRHMSLVTLFVSIALLINSCLSLVEALYPFKLIHNSSHEIALTPEEWSSEFKCKLTNVKEAEQNGSLPLDCYRDENTWLFKHVDEIHDQFKLLVQQDSLDERFADKVYAVNGHTGLDFHHYKFNTGDQARDQRLQEYAVADSRVDDKLCKQHLKQMVALLNDLSSRVDQRRRKAPGAEADQSEDRRDTDALPKLEERHFRLARVLDSYGRYESGQLAGRYHSYGMYHECLRTPMQLAVEAQNAAAPKMVDSRYCWARLNLDALLSEPLRGRGVYNVTWGDFAFHLATCLPSSCHSKSFANDRENLKLLQILVDSQYEMPSSMYLNASQPVDSVYCLVDPDSKLGRMPLSGRLLVAFLCVWLGLCLLATYKRRHKHNVISDESRGTRRKSFWSHIDLIESYYDFIGTPPAAATTESSQSDKVNLDVLNCVRCILTFLVVATHASIVFGPISLSQLQQQAIMDTGRLEAMTQLGYVVIDTFFVITALITTYLALKKFARVERAQILARASQLALPATVTSKRKMTLVGPDRTFSPLGASFYRIWFYMTVHRYLRLVPLFFLVFWFKKGLFVWLGSGPMWDYGTNRDTQMGGCQQETWLTPFTPLAAYLPLSKQCLPQSWSIANDMAFAFYIPPMIMLLFKHPKLAYLCSAVTLVLGLYFGFRTYYLIPAPLRFDFDRLRNQSVVVIFQNFSQSYSIPSYRVPAIVFGVLAGHVLFKWQQRASRSSSKSSSRLQQQQLQIEGALEQRTEQVTAPKEDRYNWPWWFRSILTPAAIAYIIYNVVSATYMPELRKSLQSEGSKWLPIYLVGFHHFFWSLSNAIVLLRMVSDWRDRYTMRLYASRFFKVASKLSYAFLLFHWDILYYDAMIENQSMEFTRWNYLKNLCLAYFFSIVVTIPAHIIVENPIDKLIRTYVLRV